MRHANHNIGGLILGIIFTGNLLAAENQHDHAFNVPNLIGKSIDEIRDILGPPKNKNLEPTEQQSDITKWQNCWTTHGKRLLITFNINTREVIDPFILLGQGISKDTTTNRADLRRLGNLKSTAPNYQIEYITAIDIADKSKLRGIKIYPATQELIGWQKITRSLSRPLTPELEKHLLGLTNQEKNYVRQRIRNKGKKLYITLSSRYGTQGLQIGQCGILKSSSGITVRQIINKNEMLISGEWGTVRSLWIEGINTDNITENTKITIPDMLIAYFPHIWGSFSACFF